MMFFKKMQLKHWMELAFVLVGALSALHAMEPAIDNDTPTPPPVAESVAAASDDDFDDAIAIVEPDRKYPAAPHRKFAADEWAGWKARMSASSGEYEETKTDD